MNPGLLNCRITIQRYIAYEDDYSVSKKDWIDLKTIWCSMNNLFGREYWSAKQYNAENTVEFIIRYHSCSDLSIKDRIKFEDRLFNISSVDNIMYKNAVIKIKAMEVI